MSGDQPVLEPLRLNTPPPDITVRPESPPSGDGVRCLFCEICYKLPNELDVFLKHLLLVHKLVIADVKLVANFERYFDHWRRRFREAPLTEFCSVIQTNSKPTDPEPTEMYYLLCDVLSEDKELRMRLQQEKLDSVLCQQQLEREETSFNRGCLFCKETFSINRSELINHMAQEHNLNVGQPDNLVYTTEFLDLLEEKLKGLQCLFCEKTFKDRHVLKEHMRKKQHKKINPQNKIYDKFYVINYLELGKNWETLQSEPDVGMMVPDPGEESDTASVGGDEWGDWVDDTGASVVCLYCDTAASNVDKIMVHMKDVHNFDLAQIKVEQNLSFYQEVKLINYIRRQVHQHSCPFCQEKSDSRDSLLDHMNFLGHVSKFPEHQSWDQPQYFFPTYEDDALLCGLEDVDPDPKDPDTSASSCDSVVIAEDCVVTESILQQHGLRQELLS